VEFIEEVAAGYDEELDVVEDVEFGFVGGVDYVEA